MSQKSRTATSLQIGQRADNALLCDLHHAPPFLFRVLDSKTTLSYCEHVRVHTRSSAEKGALTKSGASEGQYLVSIDLAALLFASVGFFCAGLGSLIGIGGGLLLVPALDHFTSLPMHEIIPLSLFNIVINSSVVSAQRLKKNLINLRAASVLEPCCLIGGFLSAWIAQILESSSLARGFAVFCLAMGIFYARKATSSSADEPKSEDWSADSIERGNLEGGSAIVQRPKRLKMPAALLTGTAGSFAAGLLGIGGGVILVPLLNVGFRLPLKVSAGTSSYIIGTTATGALLPYLWKGHVDFVAAVWLCLGAALGVYTAGLFFHQLSNRAMMVGFSLFLFAISWRMWFR